MKCPLINLGLVLDLFISRSLGGSKFWADGITRVRWSIPNPSHGTMPRSRGALPLGRPQAMAPIIGKTWDICSQKIEQWLTQKDDTSLDTGLSFF